MVDVYSILGIGIAPETLIMFHTSLTVSNVIMSLKILTGVRVVLLGTSYSAIHKSGAGKAGGGREKREERREAGEEERGGEGKMYKITI